MNPYYEKNRGVMTVSSFKALDACPQGALAEMAGIYTPEDAVHFLVGSYVDRALLTPDELPAFIADHAEDMLLKSGPNKGKMKAPFQQADAMISKARQCDMFRAAITGQTQVQVDMEVEGIPVRCTIDCVDRESGILTDLKTVRTFDWSYDADHKMRLPFYEVFNYWLQVAVYVEAYRHLYASDPALINLACVDKHDHPTLRLIVFSLDNPTHAHRLQREWSYFTSMLAIYWQMKKTADSGAIKTHADITALTTQRCERCDYCRMTSTTLIEEAESLIVK